MKKLRRQLHRCGNGIYVLHGFTNAQTNSMVYTNDNWNIDDNIFGASKRSKKEVAGELVE